MIARLITRLPAAGVDLALGVPLRATRWVTPTAGAVVRGVVDAAEAGVRTGARGAAAVSETAVRVGRVGLNALTPGRGYWQAGSRLQLPLRPRPGAGVRNAEAAARRVAASLAERPDVLAAYWDGGLARLVVRMTQDAVTDRVVARVGELAAGQKLDRPDEDVLEPVHPGHTGGIRSGALAVACDAVGITTAVAARTVHLKSTPRLVTAGVTLMREDPRVRAVLRRRLGRSATDLVLAAANAAAQGIGQSPTALALDAVLRVGQLTEAVARAAAFDAAHDTLCAPGRLSLAGQQVARPPVHRYPGEEYRDHAVTGTLLGAAGTLLFTRDVQEAAEALLAGNPKAARYGPAAFAAALCTELAREGVLVRNLDRLRQLELVDTVVLHPEALRGTRRTVLDVNPNVSDWDHDRLWQAATAALESGGELDLRPVPDQGEPDAGLMIASDAGRDIGTVLVGWEIDPLAEASLDAARRAGLYVVVLDDGSLGDFGALADELVGAERPLAEVVKGLQRDGRVVLTVAHVPCGNGTVEQRLGDESREVLTGLLRSDIAVSLTDDRSAVVWPADVLLLHGLTGAWRLLDAVPAARAVGRHSKVFAEAGAALAGLLVVTRGKRSKRVPFPPGFRVSPVDAAAGAALVSGWRAALRVSTDRAPHPPPRVPWHALQPQEALARLRARAARPSALEPVKEALARASRHPVFTPARMTVRLFAAVRDELHDPLTPLLLVGATASAMLGSVIDALMVLGAMGVNALVGGVQRVRAERALSGLRVGQRQRARRIVDSGAFEVNTVEARRLTAGEMIELYTGDVVPADARLLAAEDLEVDESSLTGESLPTAKQVDATPQAPVTDRRCMVFEGTTVVAGHGRAVVVGTGDETEAGRAAHLASRAQQAPGVQARLHELTRRMLPFTLLGGAAVTGLSLLRGRPVRQAVRGGLAVAVAAVPEGLPLVATVAQLAATRRLSRIGILVRTPRALEALGRMDTICFDKTGTLTENRLRVVRVATADGTAHPADAAEAAPLLHAAALTCRTHDEEAGIHAHSTDEAILAASPPGSPWTVAEVQPFEASRGYAAAVGTGEDDARFRVVKGAPEVVLPGCRDADGDAVAQTLAAEGLRVLAVARDRLEPHEDPDEALGRPLADMDLLGFVALADTPRRSSAPLVAELREAGVRPVMLTGDHPETARAVAVQLGWPDDVAVVTGEELAARDRAGRARLLRDCDVVARVAPEQKLQVVEALQEAGRVVAMVGDGANDAAAIRAADIGVGIAVRGSAAARNAADLVITSDDLSMLVAAVAEGRGLWRSVADAISVLIGGNAGEIGFSVLGTLLSGSSPLSTRQILLVNLLTDMFPAMAVSVTPRDEITDERPDGESALADSVPVGLAALGDPLTRQIRHRGIVTALGAATAWLIGTATPGSARRTSTMALCGVVGAQLTQTVTGRSHSPLVLLTALGSAAVLAVLIETPLVSQFFGCTPLGPVAWTGVATAMVVAALAPRVIPPIERHLSGLGARLGT
ncbi:cation-translocating P-type ATPase [Streptomyces sp. FH025]|uniref:cation-translocating P-type ATPase n=1 Tax=Streptomyces sp. FH025 TaxID=2815937 RepID=UPI001A9D9CC3|nr:cation-translocating P-type ATPase [Streptomyces sp. FH025]MBO1413461.1 cation-translocating P-type ATPase [Streptomyces sp. FH025]